MHVRRATRSVRAMRQAFKCQSAFTSADAPQCSMRLVQLKTRDGVLPWPAVVAVGTMRKERLPMQAFFFFFFF